MALLLAVGCSGSGDSNSTDNDDGGRASDTTLDHSLDDDAAVPGSAELEQRLLTLDDLPDGLIDLDRHYAGVEICGMRTEMPGSLDGDQFPTAAAAFAPDDEPIVPDVLEKIVVVPAGEGAQVFQRAGGLLDTNCTGGGEVDGLSFVNATDLAVPTLGDESVAKRVTINEIGSGRIVGIDILYARDGDTIVAVGVIEPQGQTDRLVELASLAFQRATT